MYSFQCKVHEKDKTVAADFGNCLAIENPEGELVDQARSSWRCSRPRAPTIATTVTAAEVAILGQVNYRQAGWYERTAGVQDFGYGHDSWCAEHIAKRPLLLLSPRPGAVYAVIVAESARLHGRPRPAGAAVVPE